MTKDEYMNLHHSGKMLEAIKADPALRADKDCLRALNVQAEEEEKAWQIEHFGHYDPDILFDPLPRDPNNR